MHLTLWRTVIHHECTTWFNLWYLKVQPYRFANLDLILLRMQPLKISDLHYVLNQAILRDWMLFAILAITIPFKSMQNPIKRQLETRVDILISEFLLVHVKISWMFHKLKNWLFSLWNEAIKPKYELIYKYPVDWNNRFYLWLRTSLDTPWYNKAIFKAWCGRPTQKPWWLP